ncbi:MAG: DeoR/GlpR family DNA-binding transcription regulator [Lactobacillus crispatus]|jgi:transcriptional regulator, DeoR family|uniref:DeoR/GlpR family DNA-binding transcription regulator n=1 Tax=Lactobacillus crispatus TaxID=47770 RepID=UPI00076FD253|nr:DeoR/GlpR family DNA-binding transcription regulator [Lactobacillus crispatus]KXI18466.1 transcriptional regulator, DeoR family [Lactobacillus crispatus]MCT7808010.1 DeoR/GlpR family DNA-binding transcription regulator [Lactobacillus crispatus]MCT7816601.1 DeoR/GlpR family DNA-binding transcription regulator [Lactobacillus crispatus]MCT7832506.1 DeoR/GlpR family DNA-binding transcription regulator [Lactobacillus crispatus]MCT7870322.1 DeoR/GlpR family DNA-binding transcription regulator [La
MITLKLKKQERQDRIVLLLNRTGFMTSNSLAKQIGVTSMTIRRDINELDQAHKVIKTYGGAKPLSNDMTVEFSTSQKLTINVELKKQIGEKLANIIEDGATVFLGAGTTLMYSLPFLIKKNLTFVTNSFISFSKLATTSDCRVLSTGGELHKNTGEFLGQIAERTFDGLNLDYALCSTNGIRNNDVTTSSEDEGRIQNVAINHATKALIIADHTKLGRSDIITFRNLNTFNGLVTDNEISSEQRNLYSEYTKVW